MSPNDSKPSRPRHRPDPARGRAAGVHLDGHGQRHRLGLVPGGLRALFGGTPFEQEFPVGRTGRLTRRAGAQLLVQCAVPMVSSPAARTGRGLRADGRTRTSGARLGALASRDLRADLGVRGLVDEHSLDDFAGRWFWIVLLVAIETGIGPLLRLTFR